MGRYQPWMIEYISNRTLDFVQPASRRNEVLGFLKAEPLEDLCISRPIAR